MASCTDNKAIADAQVIALYPEILIVNPVGPALTADITETMDVLASVGRLSYTITLLDKDHGPALVAYLTTGLNSNGYVAKADATTVTVSCGGC